MFVQPQLSRSTLATHLWRLIFTQWDNIYESKAILKISEKIKSKCPATLNHSRALHYHCHNNLFSTSPLLCVSFSSLLLLSLLSILHSIPVCSSLSTTTSSYLSSLSASPLLHSPLHIEPSLLHPLLYPDLSPSSLSSTWCYSLASFLCPWNSPSCCSPSLLPPTRASIPLLHYISLFSHYFIDHPSFTLPSFLFVLHHSFIIVLFHLIYHPYPVLSSPCIFSASKSCSSPCSLSSTPSYSPSSLELWSTLFLYLLPAIPGSPLPGSSHLHKPWATHTSLYDPINALMTQSVAGCSLKRCWYWQMSRHPFRNAKNSSMLSERVFRGQYLNRGSNRKLSTITSFTDLVDS